MRYGHRRVVVLFVIVATHTLLLEVLFRNGKPQLRRAAIEQAPGELFFFELPAAMQPESEPARRPAVAQPVTSRRAAEAYERPQPQPVTIAPIDWYGDAERLARDGLTPAPEKPRAFGEVPRSPYQPRRKASAGYVWQPEEKKAGFDGPLPFLRLGKRCILIPPFIGCALGKLPHSAGATLRDIRDPQRPRNSVPDDPPP